MFGVDDPEVVAAVRAYVKLMRASRAVLARVEPLLAEAGLTPTQLGVLEALLHRGNGLTHRDLSRLVLTSPGNMTDLINRLEKRGLVCRIRDIADRRSVRVELTAAGSTLIEELFPRHARDIARAMSGLDTAGLDALGVQLRRLGMAAAREPEDAADPGIPR